MTIRTRAFKLYLLTILILGACIWFSLFINLYQPSIELRPDSFIVLDTNAGSVSLQWRNGMALWINGAGWETRVFP